MHGKDNLLSPGFQKYVADSTKKDLNAVIMFSKDTDFTPNFIANILSFRELVESYSEHYGFWYLGLLYQVDITMDMP